jgi:plastocyanin
MRTNNMQTRERYRRIYRGDVRTKSLLAVIGFVLGLGFMQFQAFAASPNTKVESPNQIVIGDFEFVPATLTVPVGTTITWANRDDEAHTVNSVTDTFKSSPLDTDDKFSFKFTAPGTYPYYCKLHPHMKGQIVVQ